MILATIVVILVLAALPVFCERDLHRGLAPQLAPAKCRGAWRWRGLR